jgi:uncharacterized protein YutE (UPF0331/DUF86 family)
MSAPPKFDDALVLAKADIVRRCLRAIAAATNGEVARLSDWMVRDVLVLNLQRAVQALIDLSQHLVAENGLPLPDQSSANFIALAKEGWLPNDLASVARNMVGFRNVAVHAYREIDDAILASIFTHHLGDLQRVADHLVRLTVGRPA